MKDYSQYGESSILDSIFKKIGTVSNYGVEFGSSDGYWLSNLRYFLELGWKGLQMEGISRAGSDVKQEFITRENINELFDKYAVPQIFDLLSIDIDGNDYWVWKEINRTPNVVIIEYNSNFSHDEAVTLEYDPNHIFDNSYAYGASFKAMCDLARYKGYYLYHEILHTNLIFVKDEFKDIAPPLYNGVTLPFKQHGQILQNKRFVEVNI
jgi:hypothetical protein